MYTIIHQIHMSMILFCLSISITAQAQRPELIEVDQYLTDYLQRIPVPGFSIAIVEDDQVTFSKGYGVERAGAAQRMTPASILPIGAVARGFTAMAILQLVEEGKLSLDQPIVEYIPWFTTANPEFSQQITLRMCLSNTTAIPPQYRSQPSLDESDALASFLESFSALMIKRKPGLSHEFSSEGYSIAGYLISQVSGMSYEAYIKEKILQPLRMTRSTAGPTFSYQSQILHGHEMGLDACTAAEADRPDPNYAAAGSQTYSTVDDLSHYMIALLNGGVYQGQRILSEAAVNQLFQPNSSFEGLGTMLGGNGIDIQYALGWMGMEIEGRPIMLHTGGNGQVASIIGINRQRQQAFAMLFNADVNQLDRFEYPGMEHIINNVIHLLNGEETTDFGVIKDNLRIEEDYDLPASDYQKYLGRYEPAGRQSPFFRGMSLEVRQNSGALMELLVHEDSTFKGHYELDFTNESRAILRNISQPQQIKFKIYPDGSIGGLFMRGSEFKKLDPDESQKYTTVSSPDGTASFELPSNLSYRWTADDELVAEADELRMSLTLSTLSTTSFENFVSTQLGSQLLVSSGLLNSMTIKKGIWTEQSLVTGSPGELSQQLCAIFQDPTSKRQINIAVVHPWGDYSINTVKMIQRIQRSVILR